MSNNAVDLIRNIKESRSYMYDQYVNKNKVPLFTKKNTFELHKRSKKKP